MSSCSASPPSLSRDTSLDVLRGALLLMMALNHIPSALRWLTDQPLGYVSSAEGFVFMSGLVAGKVYTLRARRSPQHGMWSQATKRALHLYRAHAWTLLGVFAWTWAWYAITGELPAGGQEPFLARPIASLGAGLLLLYQPGLLDILPLYCGMMLLLPLVLSQLARARGAYVLGVSVCWWALTNLLDSQQPFMRGVILTGAFNFGAWQLLFVLGAWVGHGAALGQPVLARMKDEWIVPLVISIGVLACARHGWLTLPIAPESLRWLTNKTNLAPLRLLDVALVFYAVGTMVGRFGSRLRAPMFALIGRQSLTAFCTHVLVANAVLAFPALFEETPLGRWAGPAVLVSAMLAAAFSAERSKQAARAPLPACALLVEETGVSRSG
jgi:hypothetical protein